MESGKPPSGLVTALRRADEASMQSNVLESTEKVKQVIECRRLDDACRSCIRLLLEMV